MCTCFVYYSVGITKSYKMYHKNMNQLLLNILLIVIILPDLVDLRRRHGHHKRTPPPPPPSNSSFTEPVITHKKHKCGIKMKPGCSCSKASGNLAVSCTNGNLRNVPTFDPGIGIVKTLNLQNNRISDFKLGDFYGMKIERLLLGNNTLSQLNVLAFWGLEYYLETLDVSFNNFYSVPYAALRLLRHLRSLNLSGNYIKSLRKYGFSSLNKLEVLSLDRNPIEVIKDDAFSGTNLYLLVLDELSLPNGLNSIPTKDLSTLKGLSLARNNIDTIPNQWFSNFTSLKYLKMDDNRLTNLPSDVFVEVCLSLRTLELNSNRLRKVPKDALRLLVNLETLKMSHNDIKRIHARSFNCSRNLKTLNVRGNSISEISNAAFHGLDLIQRIDLRDNELITLDDRLFYWENKLNREVLLSGNPWLCNCLVKWIKKAHRKGDAIVNIFPDLIKMRCYRPDFLEGKPIIRVHLKEFTCDHEYYYYEYEEEEGAEGDDSDVIDPELVTLADNQET